MSYNNSNIDTSTSELGGDYDYLNSLYTKYTTSDSKTIISNQKQKENKIEEFLLNFFDWKIVFGVLLSVTLLCSIGLNKLYNYLKYINIYTPYGLDMISYFYYGIIINMFIMVFTISFYFNVRTNTGMQGPKGPIGKKGAQGESDYCDICNIKPIKLKRAHKYEETKLVDIPSNLKELSEIEHGWKLVPKNNQQTLIKCKDQVIASTKPNELTYLIGVIANLDSITKNIKQLQFIFRNNDNNTIQFPENRIPNTYNELKNVQSEQAPINSGIYKIDIYKNNNIIVGLKLYYIDYKKPNSNLKSKGIPIGNTTNYFLENTIISNKDYKYNGETYTSLLSELTCNYNNNGICDIELKKQIINLDYKI